MSQTAISGRFDSCVNYKVPKYVKIVTNTQVAKQHYKLIMVKIISGYCRYKYDYKQIEDLRNATEDFSFGQSGFVIFDILLFKGINSIFFSLSLYLS